MSCGFSATGWSWVLLSALTLRTTFVLGIVPLISKGFTKPGSLNRIIFWATKRTKFGLVSSISGGLCHGFHQQGLLLTCHINISEIYRVEQIVQLSDIGHNGLTKLMISFVKFSSLNNGS